MSYITATTFTTGTTFLATAANDNFDIYKKFASGTFDINAGSAAASMDTGIAGDKCVVISNSVKLGGNYFFTVKHYSHTINAADEVRGYCIVTMGTVDNSNLILAAPLAMQIPGAGTTGPVLCGTNGVWVAGPNTAHVYVTTGDMLGNTSLVDGYTVTIVTIERT